MQRSAPCSAEKWMKGYMSLPHFLHPPVHMQAVPCYAANVELIDDSRNCCEPFILIRSDRPIRVTCFNHQLPSKLRACPNLTTEIILYAEYAICTFRIPPSCSFFYPSSTIENNARTMPIPCFSVIVSCKRMKERMIETSG